MTLKDFVSDILMKHEIDLEETDKYVKYIFQQAGKIPRGGGNCVGISDEVVSNMVEWLIDDAANFDKDYKFGKETAGSVKVEKVEKPKTDNKPAKSEKKPKADKHSIKDSSGKVISEEVSLF